mgnify:CR=1 FL=1
MKLRYTTLGPKAREIKINLKTIQVISWRFTYTRKRDITHLYLVYLDENTYRTSFYAPVDQILDKAATFEYLETNFKDKCLEK